MNKILSAVKEAGINYDYQTQIVILEDNTATDLVVGFRVHTIGDKEKGVLDPFVRAGTAHYFLVSGEIAGYYIPLPESDKLWKELNEQYQKPLRGGENVNKSIYEVQAKEVKLFRKKLAELEKLKGQIEEEIELLELRKELYDKIQSEKIESPESIFNPTIELIYKSIDKLESELKGVEERIANHSDHIDALIKVINYF